MKYYRALDNFTADLPNPVGVMRGAVLPEKHPAVQHDLKNGGRLFALMDDSEPAPAKRTAKKSGGDAE